MELNLVSMDSFMIYNFLNKNNRFSAFSSRRQDFEEPTECISSCHLLLAFICFICFKSCISFQMASSVTKNEFRA